jgi:hypothetical protein
MLTAGCSDDAEVVIDPEPVERPDPVVNEQMSHQEPYVDTAVPMDLPTLFRTTDVLPDVDVRRLAVVGTDVYAGTATGLSRLNAAGTAFETVSLTGSGAVLDLAVRADQRLVVARAAEVQVLTAAGEPGDVWPAIGPALTSIATHGNAVYGGTTAGLVMVSASGATAVAGAQGFSARDLVVAGDVVWIATDQGVLRYDIDGAAMLAPRTAPGFLPDDDVRALARSADGTEVLAATEGGLARIAVDGSEVTLVVPEVGGLPNGDVRAVAERGGVVLTGHEIGATAMSATHKDHYHTLRWIPDQRVHDVALGPDGTRWIATSLGISRIRYEDRSLADKSDIFDSFTDRYWRMDGFVSVEVHYDDEWTLAGEPLRYDKDNDGLWTQMQLAGWCFAYAATGDEQYYQWARKAMDNMQLQFDVPALTFEAHGMDTGFITRSLVRSDEGEVFDDKTTQDNWHLQDHGGNTYYWKDDTSSDEYAGHYFGIPIFYDLCAKTDAERQELADRAGRAMRYIIDNDYLLIDLDGEPTLHGHWRNLAAALDGIHDCLLENPADECFESFGGGGWLNAIEILGALLATWHMTGDELFYDEYERLAGPEQYEKMVPLSENTVTVTTRGLSNHSDHELASLAYYTLLRYEPNPLRRGIWLQSIRDFYEYEKLERNALEVAVMTSGMSNAAIRDAVQTLIEIPTDLREWEYDNSHRRDVERDPQLDRHDDAQFTTVLPYDEMRTFKWNGNPYRIAGGRSGRSVMATWPWTLPYWMMRYHQAIE